MMRYPALLGFVLISFILASCTGGAQAATPTFIASPTQTPGPTIQPTPLQTMSPEEQKSFILEAFRSQRSQPNQQRSEVVTEDGKIFRSQIEFVPPDKYHIVTDLHTELTIIDQKVYLKENGEWKELQVNIADIVDQDFLNRLEKSIDEIQSMGTEMLGGNRMAVYQFKNNARVGDSETTVQTRLWIGLRDGLPHKEVIQGEVAALDTGTGQVSKSVATTTILFEYDPSIEIVSPVK